MGKYSELFFGRDQFKMSMAVGNARLKVNKEFGAEQIDSQIINKEMVIMSMGAEITNCSGTKGEEMRVQDRTLGSHSLPTSGDYQNRPKYLSCVFGEL